VKRLAALLLILLALFIAVPRQACACNGGASHEASQRRCCCKKKVGQPSCHAAVSEHTVIKCHSCCGIVGTEPIALSSSISILPEGEFSAVAISVLSDLPEFLVSIGSDRPANPNRAPPRIRGMGTSKTYLYKRTFLI